MRLGCPAIGELYINSSILNYKGLELGTTIFYLYAIPILFKRTLIRFIVIPLTTSFD